MPSLPPYWIATDSVPTASWIHRLTGVTPSDKNFLDNLLDYSGDFHPGTFCMILILIPIFCLFWTALRDTGSIEAWLTRMNKPSKREAMEREHARIKLKQAQAVTTFAQNADDSIAWERHLEERRDERRREAKMLQDASQGGENEDDVGAIMLPRQVSSLDDDKVEELHGEDYEMDLPEEQDMPKCSKLPERPLGNEIYSGASAQSTRKTIRVQRVVSVVSQTADHRKLLKQARKLHKQEKRMIAQLDRLTAFPLGGKGAISAGIGAFDAGKGALDGAKKETKVMFKQALRASAVREANNLFWDCMSLETNKIDHWLMNYQQEDVCDKSFLVDKSERIPEKDSEEARDLQALATMDKMDAMSHAPESTFQRGSRGGGHLS